MKDVAYVFAALAIALVTSACTGANQSPPPGMPEAQVSPDANATTSGTSSGTQSAPKVDENEALKKKLDASRPGTTKDL